MLQKTTQCEHHVLRRLYGRNVQSGSVEAVLFSVVEIQDDAPRRLMERKVLRELQQRYDTHGVVGGA